MLDIDIILTSKDFALEDGVYVWMYTSLQSKFYYNQYESASCLVQYSPQSANWKKELTKQEMEDLVSVNTYVRTGNFAESS